ncbi:MAG: glycoside hydrolase family 97 catalytic domain-containing protein [Clostridia bacterium]|nr:glycoside hydrolase family 97 catalytic domain-containing protein [Clostridia bacterium]
MTKRILPVLIAILMVSATLFALVYTSSGDSTYIDLTTITPYNVSVGWGNLTLNKGLDGQSLDMANEDGTTTVYEKGFTAHASSSMSFKIEGLGVSMFTAYAGAEHSTNNQTTTSTSIMFQVYADDELVYETGVLSYNDPAVYIQAPIPAGAKVLKLVTDEVEAATGDHSAWGEPRLYTDPEALKRFNSIELSSEKSAYVKGSTAQLAYAFKDIAGDEVVPDSISFTSSKPDVATVDKNGLITAKAKGTVIFTLTATKDDVTLSQSLPISFMDKVTPQDFVLTSPDGNLTFTVSHTDEGSISYTVSDKSGLTMVNPSFIGVNTEVCNFSNALALENKSEIIEHNDTYTAISGKRSEVKNHYNEQILSFSKDEYFFDVYLRAYDDGFAYNFVIRRADGKEEKIKVIRETGTFSLPEKSSLYAQKCGSLTTRFCYEEPYESYSNTTEKRKTYSCFPMLVRVADDQKAKTDTYMLLNESNLYGDSFAGSLLESMGNCVYQMQFAPETDTGDVVITTSFTSPWRYGIVGSIDEIVESDLTEKLADAPEGDYSWVVPGTTAWMWLSEHFDGQRNEATIREYVDLAAEMGWKYLILDEGWQPGGRGSYNGYFPFFADLVEYAESKGVGFIAWVLKEDLDTPEELDVLNDWAAHGIKGIKADFFDNEDQATIDVYKSIYERCAELKLVVNCHGANKPTGERRTYPNVINREAVNGEEFGSFDMGLAMYWIYTRNVVGPIDITPKLYSTGGHTTGAQMAVNVVFESGMPCMASAPEDYLDFSANSFYKKLPAAWDDTVFLDGGVGLWASIARRTGDNWYASSMTLSARKGLEMDLSFLEDGAQYYAIIYRDTNRRDIAMETKLVTSKDKIAYDLLEHGGFNVKFLKVNDDGKYLPTEIVPEKATIEAIQGIRQTISYTLKGEDILMDTVTFTSSDPEVVSVTSRGMITPIKPGKATITIASAISDKIKTTIEVTVSPSPLKTNDLLKLVNQRGENPVSYILDDVNKIQLSTTFSNIKNDKPGNELVYSLPETDFQVSVCIDDFSTENALSGGVMIHADGQYVAVERAFNNENLIACFGDGVKLDSTKDYAATTKNRPYIVIIKLEGDKMTVKGGFSATNTRTFAELDITDRSNMTIGLYAITTDVDEVQSFTFSNLTVNDTVIPFAISTDPSDDPIVDPSVSTEESEPSEIESESVVSSPESEPQNSTTPSEGGDNEKDDDKKDNTGVVIAVIAVALVVVSVAVVAVVIIKKRKK